MSIESPHFSTENPHFSSHLAVVPFPSKAVTLQRSPKVVRLDARVIKREETTRCFATTLAGVVLTPLDVGVVMARFRRARVHQYAHELVSVIFLRLQPSILIPSFFKHKPIIVGVIPSLISIQSITFSTNSSFFFVRNSVVLVQKSHLRRHAVQHAQAGGWMI